MKGAHKLVTTHNVENIILEYSPGVGEVWRRRAEVGREGGGGGGRGWNAADRGRGEAAGKAESAVGARWYREVEVWGGQ